MKKLFIFDMGEVLVLNIRNLQEIAVRFGLDNPPFRADYGLYDKPLMEGYMDSMDYFRHMNDKYGLSIEENLFVKDFHPVTNTRLLPLIDRLRENGHRCVLGSNTFAPHIEVISRLPEKPLDHLDHLYMSHVMHIAKPLPAFWNRILKEEGRRPEETVFIDDRRDNLEAAESLGIQGYQFSASRMDEAENFLCSFLD